MRAHGQPVGENYEQLIEQANQGALTHLTRLVLRQFAGTTVEGYARMIGRLPAPIADYEREVAQTIHGNQLKIGVDQLESVHDIVRRQVQSAWLTSAALAVWTVAANGRYTRTPDHYQELWGNGFVKAAEEAPVTVERLLEVYDKTLARSVVIPSEVARDVVETYAADWLEVPFEGQQMTLADFKRYARHSLSGKARDSLREEGPSLADRVSRLARRAVTYGPPTTAAVALGATVAQPAAAYVMQEASSLTALDAALPGAQPITDVDGPITQVDPAVVRIRGEEMVIADLSAPRGIVVLDGPVQSLDRPIVADPVGLSPKREQQTSVKSPEAQKQAINRIKTRGGKWARRAYIFERLIDKDLTPEQAAAVVGNLDVESAGVNPRQDQFGYDGDDEGMGIAQWAKNARWRDLKRFAGDRDIYDLATQFDFMWHEMTTVAPWDKTIGHLRKAKTVEEAVIVFEKYYEKAGKPALGKRAERAHELLDAYKQELRKLQKAERHRQAGLSAPARQTNERSGTPDYDYGINHRLFRGSIATPKSPRAPIATVLKRRGFKNGNLASQTVRIGEAWGDIRLHPQAAEAFRALDAAFKARFGHHLEFVGHRSGYRTVEQQVEIQGESRKGFAAKPRGSIHGWGLAVDLELTAEERAWMAENAITYGFVHPYFARKKGPTPEPWHWEYTARERR